MKKGILKYVILFVVGIVIALLLPIITESAYRLLLFFSLAAESGNFFNDGIVDRLLPVVKLSTVLISSGLQILGISGIVATILKKDN